MYFKKRSLDLLLILLFFPIILLIIILLIFILFVFTWQNPFFIQERTGKNKIIFKLIKFKTMNDVRDQNNNLLSDDKRVTKIGKFLRKTSLDELPTIINIIKGDMSIVGPRPLLKEYLILYDNYQLKRFNVLPGLTGLAQINGRNSISWKQKFKYDVEYVENQSIFLDLIIILKSIKIVLIRENINSSIRIGSDKFMGNDYE